LEYKIKSLTAGTNVDATTYIDLMTRQVTHGQDVAEFFTPLGASLVDFALASGANALGFPPVVLDRSSERETYTRNGTSLPATGSLWCTDGGTLSNEPLGHTLDRVAIADRDADETITRLHILVHPHPTAAPRGDAWADPKNSPTWLATLMRADHLQRTQSLYDDLRRVEKTNTRIAWLERLETELQPVLARLEPESRDELVTALRNTLHSIEDDRQSLRASSERSADPSDVASLFRTVAERVAGVSGKRKVAVEVISPLVIAAQNPGVSVEDMLAGEMLAHFGGFFDERLRVSDFDLGYQCTQTWLEEGGLERHGLDAADARAAKTAATVYTPEERWREWGKTTVGQVAARHPFALAGLLAQIARVAGQDVITRHRHEQK
jgi:hypothetical protein